MTTSYWRFKKGIRIRIAGGRVLVSSEYNRKWIEKCHVLNGKFRARTRLWSFQLAQYEWVARYIHESYGVVVPGTVSLLLKAHKDVPPEPPDTAPLEDSL